MARVITAAVFLLFATVLVIGGVWLIVEGDTWAYALIGLAFGLVAALLLLRNPAALWAYAVLVVAAMGWAWWEVGFDWWQLAPRGWIIVAAGAWLLVPWVALTLDRGGIRPRWLATAGPLALTLVLAGGVALYAVFNDPHYRNGSLNADVAEAAAPDFGVPEGEWHHYGNSLAGQRYSPLEQITPQNVANLEVAWQYNTGDMRREGDPEETTYQVTPLKIDDTLYLCTPHHWVIALDATTGEERWVFDPEIPLSQSRQHQTCRGVSFHENPDAQAGDTCARRIFIPTADARLIALDAESGQICTDFADNGAISLWRNMPNVQEGFYYSTSPVVIANDVIVVGGAVNDNVSTQDPSGVIRGYDVYTGNLLWNFDTGNPDRTEPIGPDETYTPNSPNAWSILSADPDLGLVYAPIGNQPPDQYGGDRDENVERFSASVIALDIATGELAWVFRTVNHDLWDYDVPAQPSLIDLDMPEGSIPALVAPTKQGDIFVLDRRTGEPVLPVAEVPAPQGAVPGDWTAETQPRSALSFRPPRLRPADMWGATLFDQLWCRVAFHSYRHEGIYTPPSVEGTLIHPGNFGVFNWGGVAVDPVRQAVFATPTYMAFTVTMVPREDDETHLVSEPDTIGLNENFGAPYAVEMGPFTSPLGMPCNAPPWGYVAGADLRTGEVAWQHKNGTVRDRAPVPLPFTMGVPNLGGPLVTAGGVAFLSGTIDYFVRAYDLTSGTTLWQSRLPAGGQATPMSYLGEDGAQYVVVVAGGHGSLGTKAGDAIIAYRLPR
jgi:quinoprotein glucose dehydrogenase